MSGWCPSLFRVWNGGGVCCCCPAQCSGVARALLIPPQYSSVLRSCRALFIAGCGVWVSVCVCAVRVVGYPLSALPLVVVVGGAIVDGGRHGEWRAVVLLTSPSCVWCPPSVREVGPLKGGDGGGDVPRLRVAPPSSRCSPSCVALFPLCCSIPPCVAVIPLPFVWCCVCCGWGIAVGGELRWRVLSSQYACQWCVRRRECVL